MNKIIKSVLMLLFIMAVTLSAADGQTNKGDHFFWQETAASTILNYHFE